MVAPASNAPEAHPIIKPVTGSLSAASYLLSYLFYFPFSQLDRCAFCHWMVSSTNFSLHYGSANSSVRNFPASPPQRWSVQSTSQSTGCPSPSVLFAPTVHLQLSFLPDQPLPAYEIGHSPLPSFCPLPSKLSPGAV